MEFQSKYRAKKPDEKGHINYTEEENGTWHTLIERQVKILPHRAYDGFISALDLLALSHDHIPQLYEMNEVLARTTGWGVEAVPALIPAERFFELMSHKKFPAATFIRHREELDYLQEPDLFHEYFGHCPMLTNSGYADFVHRYGEIALKADEEARFYLQRLFWFTIEFGLIATDAGVRIYGGGILSSYEETQYAVDSDIPERIPFDLVTAFRMPYRIDILQPVYFVIENMSQLYDILADDLATAIAEAKRLGDLPKRYSDDDVGNTTLSC